MNTVGKTAGICCLVLAVLVLLNFLSGLIPVKSMQKNLIASAEYYLSLSDDSPTFIDHVEGDGRTSEHVYADAVLMNIIACFDREDFWGSSLKVPYFYDGTGQASSLLASASGTNDGTNRLYSRYWHGTLMFTRLEMLFTDARGIHLINGIWLGILVIGFTVICIKKRYWSLAIGYLFAFGFTRSWYSFYSIEYMSCFSLSLLSASAVMLLPRGKLTGETPILIFAVTAVMTAFFDFLTNETLTCLVPLICLSVRLWTEKDYKFRSLLLITLKLGAIWFGTWVLTFALRWLLSAATPGAQTLSDILGRAQGWIDGEADGALPAGMSISAIYLCLKRIFPFDTPTEVFMAAGAFYALFLAAILIGRGMGHRNWKPLLVLLLPAFLPYTRYLVLAHHSFGHPRFAYRAQVSSIFAMTVLSLSALLPRLKRIPPKGNT